MKHLLYASLVLSTAARGMEYSEITPLIQAEEIEDTFFQNTPSIYQCQLCDIAYDAHNDYEKHLDSVMHKMKATIAYRNLINPLETETIHELINSLSQPLVEATPVELEEQSASTYIPKEKQCPDPDCRKILKGSLKNHMLTHTGQKPFQCSKCSYASSQRANCARHIRAIHYQHQENAHIQNKSGIFKVLKQEFTCTRCNKTYCEKTAYVRHKKESVGCKSKL